MVDQEEIWLELLNHERSVDFPTAVSLKDLRNVEMLSRCNTGTSIAKANVVHDSKTVPN
jgi:hypothetical protein